DIFTYWDASSPGLLPKHPDGRYGGAMTGGAEQQANNIVRTIETDVGEDKTQNYTGKLMATLNPIEGLNIKASYFIDNYNNNTWSSQEPTNTWDFQNDVIMKRGAVNPRITLSNSNSKNQRRVVDVYADYEQSFGRHNLNAVGGFNQEYFKNQWFWANKNDLYSLDVPVLDAATSEPNAGGNTYDYAIRSYFGRLNYNFAEKYLLEANVRYDGSSRFHPDQRWGLFPSFSAGWRVSEENFWSPLEDHITYLKLRASYGRLGNAGIGNYEWQSVYASANYSFNGSVAEGLAPNAIANKDITWETTDVLDIGLDIELYENMSMSVDYYNKYTHGILARTPIPLVNGGLAAPRENSAEVRNKGLETELSYNNRFGDFSLSASINGAYNKNEIVKYKGDYLEPHGAGVWTEGEPIGKYWVREIDHIVQDGQEIEKMVNNGWEFGPGTPGAGDFLYEENTGDKQINKDDRALKGNPIPKFNFGGSLQLSYKGLNLSASFSGVAGWDKYFYDNYFSLQPRTDGYLYPEKFLNSWTEENPSTEVPKLYTNDARNDQQSDYYLHDASYFRINSLQIGYDLMSNLLSVNGIQKLRVYVNFENYFTFTSYPGLDPENSGNKTYPLMKTVSFGLNMNL
ncbi:MAG: SusC/RagA family TonB-linked outer membrane protein, partial [Candidatus Paceibacterota bacterium]